MAVAITRRISPRFNECEITHIDRTPIDLEVAQVQHLQYVQALESLGCEVIELAAEPDLPDSVFVEDTAFILPEVAVITRPGADSRKPEIDSIIKILSAHKELLRVTEPGTVDGGDVLVMGKNIYIGLSQRSNQQAIHQIQNLLKAFDYAVSAVEMHDCLHLKTAITRVDDQTVLLNPRWLDTSQFRHLSWIEVDAAEPFAANCLPVNGQVIYPTSFPKTTKKLETHGCRILPVVVDELAKAEGAVTCCSLIL